MADDEVDWGRRSEADLSLAKKKPVSRATGTNLVVKVDLFFFLRMMYSRSSSSFGSSAGGKQFNIWF